MKKYEPIRLGEKLKAIREHLDLSQGEMARRIAPDEESSVFRARISMYERGQRVPTIPQILLYARVSKISLEMLLDDEIELNFCR